MSSDEFESGYGQLAGNRVAMANSEFNINLAIFNVKWKFLKITKRSSKLVVVVVVSVSVVAIVVWPAVGKSRHYG